MALTLLFVAFVCLLVVLKTGSYVPLLVGAGSVLVAWLAVVCLGSFKRWPGDS